MAGENIEEGGHYITVWAPRQCGKTWAMLEILERLEKEQTFDVVKVDLEHLKTVTDISHIVASINKDISRELQEKFLT